MLMLCVEGTVRTNTEAGKVYECIGRFICPHCGHVSPILDFEEPVADWDSIRCKSCKRETIGLGRYGHQDRFVPLTGPDFHVEGKTEHVKHLAHAETVL